MDEKKSNRLKLPPNIHDYDPELVRQNFDKWFEENVTQPRQQETAAEGEERQAAPSAEELARAEGTTPEEILLELSRRLKDSAAYPGPYCLTPDDVSAHAGGRELTESQENHLRDCTACAILLRASRVQIAGLPPKVQEALEKQETGETIPAFTFSGREGQALALWSGAPKLAGVVAVLIVLSLGGLALRNLLFPQRPSLVVLPFDHRLDSSIEKHYAYGMAEGLVSNLGSIESLNVIALNSASYMVLSGAGTGKTEAEIVGEFGVEQFVKGYVSVLGDRLRIEARGLDASTGQELWARGFERNLGDALYLEKDLAREIALQTRVEIRHGELIGLARARSVNPMAFGHYLRGRYHLNLRKMRESLKDFEEARKIEPSFAPIYASIANCYSLLVLRHVMAPAEGSPKARTAADQALNLDDMLAEAHVALAVSKMYYEPGQAGPDWAGAEKEFKRALELNPGYSAAHHWHGLYLSLVGRHAEGIREIQRALELDPLSPTTNAALGDAFLLARDYDKAIGQYLETSSKHGYASPNLVFAYLFSHKYDEAISSFHDLEKSLGPSDPPEKRPWIQATLAYIHATAGRTKMARELLDELMRPANNLHVSPYEIAMIHAALDQKDLAFRWLDKAWSQNSAYLVQLKVDPALDPLRSDPRFTKLLRQRNFPG